MTLAGNKITSKETFIGSIVSDVPYCCFWESTKNTCKAHSKKNWDKKREMFAIIEVFCFVGWNACFCRSCCFKQQQPHNKHTTKLINTNTTQTKPKTDFKRKSRLRGKTEKTVQNERSVHWVYKKFKKERRIISCCISPQILQTRPLFRQDPSRMGGWGGFLTTLQAIVAQFR